MYNILSEMFWQGCLFFLYFESVKKFLLLFWRVALFLHHYILACEYRIPSVLCLFCHCFLNITYIDLISSVISWSLLLYWQHFISPVARFSTGLLSLFRIFLIGRVVTCNINPPPSSALRTGTDSSAVLDYSIHSVVSTTIQAELRKIHVKSKNSWTL